MSDSTYQQLTEAAANLPLEELLAFQDEIVSTIKKKQKANEKVVYGQMKELARVAGYDSVEEFIASQGTKKSRGKKPPKYYNPDNPGQQWSGAGRNPGWAVKLQEEGKSLDDFLVENLESK